jgi:hypothetical protein
MGARGPRLGDTVRIGRFVGTRAERRVSIRFTHVVAAAGVIVSDAAESRIEQHDDGLRLVEDFAGPTATRPVSARRSVLVEGDAVKVTD